MKDVWDLYKQAKQKQPKDRALAVSIDFNDIFVLGSMHKI